MTRSAISPRLAIRIFLNMWRSRDRGQSGLDREQPLAVLHRLAVLHVRADDLAVVLRGDLVHQLHRFDDAEHLSFFTRWPISTNDARARLGRAIERADDRRLHHGQLHRLLVDGAGLGAATAAGAGATAAARRRRRGRRRHGAAACGNAARRPSAPGASARRVRARIPPGRAAERAPESARCPRIPSASEVRSRPPASRASARS